MTGKIISSHSGKGSTLLQRQMGDEGVLWFILLNLLDQRRCSTVRPSAHFPGKVTSDSIFKDIIGRTRLFIVDGLYLILYFSAGH